ncbi:tRNA pseudouridine synthase Pus10 [Ischnura elegans]|uniref:tRNA pseudouridine synthase Pus10 n=1 Tax=Ischnura elegans TaxID=197161 RepID=UPI001ED8A745|nr:tRNA pseudouridine synthase Pus10 [Ischnura elegans]
MRENQESQHDSIFECLTEIGCCERCSLRYIGVKDTSLYKNLSLIQDKFRKASSAEDENVENPPKRKKSCPCIACLDLLRDTEDYKTICDAVKAMGYDAKSFTCALSLPPSLQLREKSVLFFLSQRFPVVYSLSDFPNGFYNYVTLKDAWKWTYGTKIAEILNKKNDNSPSQDFFVEVNITYSDDEKECSCLLQMHADIFERRSKYPHKYGGEVFTRKSVEAALADTSQELFQQYYPCPPETPLVPAGYAPVSCYHNSLFVAGRYNKYSRILSQTPWVIDGERRVESSVQELISEIIVKAFKAQGSKFSASGREDVDVRTLGKGRPFAVELLDPHRVHVSPQELKDLQHEINNNAIGRIAIRDLQIVPKEELCKLKYGEEEKKKRYTALCVALTPPPPGALESLSEKVNDLVLHQKTPIRVLHRRPLAERLRTVHAATAEVVPSEGGSSESVHFILKLRTQAGTYVKEFVHGDFGRTEPSLGSLLGVEVDVLALDVEEIELDWPKEVE